MIHSQTSSIVSSRSTLSCRVINLTVTPAVSDVERYRPGLTKTYYDWFTYYKVARGDGVLPIVGSAYQDASFMEHVIEESHTFWRDLVRGTVDTNEINYNQTSDESIAKSYVSSSKATKKLDLPKKSKIEPPFWNTTLRARYDQWVYLDKDFKLIQLPK
jgi:inorganic pyrophosphatase